MITSRRAFLTGLGATLITAPAIVRPDSLMKIKPIIEPIYYGFDLGYGLDQTAFWFFDMFGNLRVVSQSEAWKFTNDPR